MAALVEEPHRPGDHHGPDDQAPDECEWTAREACNARQHATGDDDQACGAPDSRRGYAETGVDVAGTLIAIGLLLGLFSRQRQNGRTDELVRAAVDLNAR